jgi:iron complex outermembrane recepter protein
MIRTIFLSLILLFTSASSFATVSIRGTVKGSDTQPLEFAVVTLLNAADSSLIKGDLTDSQGEFSMEELNADSCFISISLTGFDKYNSTLLILKDGEALKLADIVLTSSKEMKEVTINASRPTFEHHAGKIVLNVESSPIRIAGTAWDLIAKCPGVFINQNNIITLKGKSGAQVYMDDRPTYLNGDALKAYLQAIPAADISQVEIISNPSARYDAAGTAGIINMITKKGSRQGFNGSARLGYGLGFRPKYNAGFNFNYKKEKYNIYGSISSSMRYDVERIELTRSVPYAGDTSTFRQYNKMYHNSPGHTTRFGIDFTPNDHFKYGVRVENMYSPTKTTGLNTTTISGLSNDSSFTLKQDNFMNLSSLNGSAGLYFKNELDSTGREFSGSFDYLRYHNVNDQKYNLHFYNPDGNETITPSFQRSESFTDINIYVSKLDYVHPFSEKLKLETGLKFSQVKTNNGFLFELLQNNAWENDTTRSNNFVYTEQIGAAYLNASYTLDKLEIMAGLRAENTHSIGESPTTGQRLERNYINLFPSVFITHKLAEKHVFNYSYSLRINRPNYENLNPFVSFLDQYTYNVGNPFLQPELQHTVDITYVFMDAVFLSVGGQHTINAMQDVTKQIDSTSVTFQTTENFAEINGAYAGLGFPIPIGNWFMMENELSYSTLQFKSDLFGTEINEKSSFVNLSTNLTVTLKHNWKIQAWSWYQSGFTYGIFQIKSQAGTGFGFSKTFFDQKLSMNLSFYDIFRRNGNRVSIQFQNQNVYFREIPESPQFNFTVRYNFGNSKAAKRSDFQSGADDLKDRTGK